MRITSKGQVTIPGPLREKFALLPDTDVDFVEDGDGVRIVKSTSGKPDRGARALGLLKGSATTSMTTDEIMDLTRGD
ncbi:AbrB/MazE/SpoVT family DNA-binding domain-containing protein [Arthrobacter castelli]|uniref:AbrB/MazE/SpoVT family DNA-binding domain-containing protein n=1 Tax=Arthrobacter castelli TaxID=271431 RepID=UPI0004797FA8|nr:AbrB/MazE/SpoVT family DNA-binding domain-containing protein [Arthrobacter castelli]